MHTRGPSGQPTRGSPSTPRGAPGRRATSPSPPHTHLDHVRVHVGGAAQVGRVHGGVPRVLEPLRGAVLVLDAPGGASAAQGERRGRQAGRMQPGRGLDDGLLLHRAATVLTAAENSVVSGVVVVPCARMGCSGCCERARACTRTRVHTPVHVVDVVDVVDGCQVHCCAPRRAVVA